MNLQEARNSKKVRLWTIGGLIALALVALYFIKGTTAKVAIGAMIAILLVAFGMEAKNTDYDMGKLIETKSFAKAKIERDPVTQAIVNADAFCNAKEIDYNCSDFKTQKEAIEYAIKQVKEHRKWLVNSANLVIELLEEDLSPR
jgi:nitrate/TMAO reductase-like tetraheme cytochrome c subunit